jgi:hypothetical protein
MRTFDSRDLGNAHTPGRTSFEVVSTEAARLIRLEVVVQRQRVMVIGQLQRLTGGQCPTRGKDQRMTLAPGDGADIHAGIGRGYGYGYGYGYGR